MLLPRYPRQFGTASSSGALLVLLLNGCGPLTETRVEAPQVDPRAAAAAAIEKYDKDSDGRLSDTELADCPAIKSGLARYDKDSDKHVSEDEIAQRLEQIFSLQTGLIEVQCNVTRRGQPLSGAKVQFVPESFLGESVQPAVATTDSSGHARPAISAENLPDNLRNLPVMQVGVYRVEIEHPSIPAGSSKPLGFEVDPTSRDGTTARFNL
jgi:hypothetical protein